MRISVLAALVLSFAMPLNAEIVPRSGPGDPQIQTVEYDPNEVVSLFTSPDIALTVQFSPDEEIETVILGDSSSWTTQTNRRADHLVIQPKGRPAPTNMTVFTSQRTYNFKLYSEANGEGALPFLVSFTYSPGTIPSTIASAVLGTYQLSGSKQLWPATISDDGSATTIRWADTATLPAVYRENDKGEPALVNGVMRDGSYVLDSVHPRLVFILGKARARAVRQAVRP